MGGKFVYCLPYLTRKSDNILDPGLTFVISSNKDLVAPVFKGAGLDKKMKDLVPIVCLDTSKFSSGELTTVDELMIQVSYTFT